MQNQMHDIDSQISRITGQDNYMETLQKITGNIMTVDMTMYKACHKKISACDFNIKVLLSRLSEAQPDAQEVKNIFAEFEKESKALNIKDGTFVMYQRKCKNPKPPREIVAPGHGPSELIKTPWFKHVKHIEKEVNKFMTSMFSSAVKPEDRTFGYLETNVYKNNPEVVDLQTLYDVKVSTEAIFTSIQQLKKCTNMIINQLLVPMYDVKGTIRKHWDKIQRIFNSKAFAQTGITSPEDIIDMLYQFIVAKYRATITGNNKHYAKLFLSVVGNDNVSNLDGARFIEIMDSIDLDKLDKNENVYKFASNAKNIIHQILNNDEINAQEVIEQINKSFGMNVDDTPATDNPKESGENVKPVDPNQYNDII